MEPLKFNYAGITPSEDEVSLCVEFLQNLRRTKGKGQYSSYHLKHAVEALTRQGYISAGAVVSAALRLGIRVEPCRDCMHVAHARIGVHSRDVDAFYCPWKESLVEIRRLKRIQRKNERRTK